MLLDVAMMEMPLKEAAWFGRSAADAGFDGIWLGEAKRDPFISLGTLAEHTDRISLGTCIALAFPRSPMILAHIAWDLQEYSDGRFILGLGTQVKGHIERRFSVKWESPGPKMRDTILALRAIWESWQKKTLLNYQGEFYNFSLKSPLFDPEPIDQPDIPIYIAGVNKYMCRLAGALCNGLHVHPLHTVRYLKEAVLPEVEAGLRETGRKKEDIQLASWVLTATGENKEELEKAKDYIRWTIAFYASTKVYRRVMEIHGWEDVAESLYKASLKGEWNEMKKEIKEEILDEFAITGSIIDAAAEMKKKYAGGLLDRVAFYPTPTLPKVSDPVWKEVIEIFKG
jgi:probable F420-dependent oxidoreductase